MKIRLRVSKADGTREAYIHTKVMHTISDALAAVDRADVSVAEHLAEVVTYYLYNGDHSGIVSSSEILAVIKATLSATGYEDAAAALGEHHYQRKLKRDRIEVLCVNLKSLPDAHKLSSKHQQVHRTAWDKSVIVKKLVAEHKMDRNSARAVAAMVEDKVFKMQLSQVPSSLVRQLVLSELAAVLRAQNQLQPT